MIIKKIAVIFFVALSIGACTQQPAQIILHGSNLAKAPKNDKNPFKITISEGDTLYKLSKKYNVEIRSLIDTNRLKPPYILSPGEMLKLPKATFHHVKKGDTLYSISRSYSMDMSQIVRVNDLTPPYVIKTGMLLRLPSKTEYESYDIAQKDDLEAFDEPEFNERNLSVVKTKSLAPPPSISAPITTNVLSNEVSVKTIPQPSIKTQPLAQNNPSPALKPSTKIASAKPSSYFTKKPRFSWPVNGKVISRFGVKRGGLYNDGINIASSKGASVKSAESGQVVYAGNELRGYGNLLLIKHGAGYITAYAHTDENLVNKGDYVKKGQTIAKVGSTGHVTSPQLHFSIRKGRKAIDPQKYLIR